jgi:hypothetical protein
MGKSAATGNSNNMKTPRQKGISNARSKMDLETIHNFNNFVSHHSSFNQGGEPSRTASRLLSTSGVGAKSRSALSNSDSKTDRSRTVEGSTALAFGKYS